ncbi:MAG: hypothetical protein KDI92_09355, partial [Xanthomonadales bacterium]|nr:hypothetical protein [Xanthomonadales bacterium]
VLKDAIAFAKENEGPYMVAMIAPQAIEFLESNQMHTDPNYHLWIKYNMMNQIYEDPDAQISDDLEKLGSLLGVNSLAYAEVLVEVTAWQSSDEMKKQLMSRLSLFESHQKYEKLLDALIALQPDEATQSNENYEQLLAKYLPLFKSNAPDLYPAMRQNYWQSLFAQQKYSQIIELADKANIIQQNDINDTDSYEFEFLAWTALLNHQYQLAQNYQQKRREKKQLHQDALKEELGFLGGMVLKDQDLYSSVLSDPLFNLAIAVQKNDPALIARELETYQAVIKTWQKTSFKDFLSKIQHFENEDSQHLQFIKYRFLFKAIRMVEPNLLPKPVENLSQ